MAGSRNDATDGFQNDARGVVIWVSFPDRRVYYTEEKGAYREKGDVRRREREYLVITAGGSIRALSIRENLL